MADLLQDAMTWLGRMFRKHASQRVTYSRAGRQVSLRATLAEVSHELEDAAGVVHLVRGVDAIVTARELTFGLGLTEPQAGDRIAWTHDSQITTLEVAAFGNLPAFQRCDMAGEQWRIHCKIVKEV